MQEVLEQVFVNVDYETLIKCSRVNKYWHYLASEKQLQNQVCANEYVDICRSILFISHCAPPLFIIWIFRKNWRIESHDLLENFNHHRRTLDLNTLQWLDYPVSSLCAIITLMYATNYHMKIRYVITNAGCCYRTRTISNGRSKINFWRENTARNSLTWASEQQCIFYKRLMYHLKLIQTLRRTSKCFSD